MATITRGSRDKSVKMLLEALKQYEARHPGAVASLYRFNPGSIRLRIISAHFQGVSRPKRHDQFLRFLKATVDEDVLAEVTLLLLLTPAELASSMMNIEFEDPMPSLL